MTKVVKFKTPYGDRTRSGFETTGDSLTQQSHAVAADVRNIIKQYDRTGLIANVNKGIAQYGDYSEINEYQESLNMVMEANESFAELPSHIREQFNNNAGLFFEFATDPKNSEKMIKMGLKEAPIIETDPNQNVVEATTKSESAPPAPQEAGE
ncbi:MAG: internal scaffolding protein [Microviridae sp.]|nr:MAG: internal scaffolding protein [Microviridae sp.]